MGLWMARGASLTLLLVSLLVSTGGNAARAQEVYQYTDDSGHTHFTDSYTSIPERYRSQVRRADLELDLEPHEPRDARASDPPPGASGSSSSDAVWNAPGMPDALIGTSLILMLLGVAIVLPFALALGALILKLACHLGGEPAIGFGRAMLVCLAMTLLQMTLTLPLQVAAGPAQPADAGTSILWLVISAALALTAQTLVLRGMHCDTTGGAIKVALLYTFLPAALGLALGLLALVLGLVLG